VVAEDTENVNATTDQKIHTLQETEEEAERDPILVDLTAQIEEEIEAEAGEDRILQEESTLIEVFREGAAEIVDTGEETQETVAI